MSKKSNEHYVDEDYELEEGEFYGEVTGTIYSQDTVDEFRDWMPNLEEAIKDGLLDKHIRSLAKACFDRAQVKGFIAPKSGNQPVYAKSDEVPNGYLFGEDGPLAKPRTVPGGYFNYRGKRYCKADFLGNKFRFTSTKGWPIQNVLCQIVSVGSTRFGVKIISPMPSSVTATKYRNMFNDGMIIPMGLVPYIFAN